MYQALMACTRFLNMQTLSTNHLIIENIAGVTNIGAIFNSAYYFNQPLDNLNIWSITDILTMFSNTKFNQLLGNWDVSSCTDMISMFYNEKTLNQPLDNWDVSSGNDMLTIFHNTEKFNKYFSSWANKLPENVDTFDMFDKT